MDSSGKFDRNLGAYPLEKPWYDLKPMVSEYSKTNKAIHSIYT